MGYTADLGTFAAGTEVEFGVYVWDTGNTWSDGPGSRNSDGAVNAYIVNDFNYQFNNEADPQGTYVGFEDESYPGGDFNYGDLQFVFNGVQGEGQNVPDAGATFSLLALGLGGLGAMRRKFKK